MALKQGVQGGLVWWLNYLDDGEEGCSGLVSGENVGGQTAVTAVGASVGAVKR